MVESNDVVIIGAGQAGLSLSHELTHAGREHLILEAGRVAQSWRERWDSFCLVLPSGTVRLAGLDYEGPEPDGFMPRDQFVEYMGRYASSFGAPVRERTGVTALEPDERGFLIQTTSGDIRAREVVVATGGYQRPYQPPVVEALAAHLPVFTCPGYTNPGILPEGRILVVGSGQSGCQLAEELLQAGREVFLACGKAGWAPRRIGEQDLFWWLRATGDLDDTVESLETPAARLTANLQASGQGGGHDLHYRTLQAAGATLVGHLVGVESGMAHFAPDLAESVAVGDARYADIRETVRKSAAARGVTAPQMPDPPPFVADGPAQAPLDGFGAVIVVCGFRPDYASWMRTPGAFDDMGLPLQEEGSSTVVPGLHFMGVPFQRRRISATLYGVGEDAQALAARMAG